MKKIIYTQNAPNPIGPYSQAILSDNTLFISGQLAINPATGKFVKAPADGGIKAETKQVLENIKSILKAADMDFGNIVKCSVFITDMSKFAEFNEIYMDYFSDSKPARETVQVARLPMDADIEISAIAVK